MADQALVKDTSPPTAAQGRFKDSQQILQHTLSCIDSECLLPHCVNMKLALKHTQGCKKINCPVCQQMTSLASKHAESCTDFYCCIPFCMEAKLKGFIQSHFDPEGPLDVASSVQGGAATVAVGSSNCESLCSAPATTTTHQNTERRPAANKSKGEGTTPNQTAPTQESSFLRPRTNSHPPVNLKRMINLSAPLTKPASSAKLPRLHSGQSRSQSVVKENVAMVTSQWGAFVEPIPVSQEGPLTTRTQATPNPFFVVNGSKRENTATKQPSLKVISSPSSTVQESEDAISHQVSQNTDREIHETTEQLSALCSVSSGAEASHSTPRHAMAIGFNDRVHARHSKANNPQTLLKARLIHTLYHLLHLVMQRLKTREELLICIESLRKALHEIKTVQLTKQDGI